MSISLAKAKAGRSHLNEPLSLLPEFLTNFKSDRRSDYGNIDIKNYLAHIII